MEHIFPHQTVPYEKMSKADLIEIIENQKSIIQRFYRLRSIPNKVLSPGEKLAWDVAKQTIAQERPNEKGLVRAPIDTIAQKIGMSDSSASRYISNICQRFDATHETEEYVTLKGQKCNLTYVKPDDPIWSCDAPDEIPLPEEKERAINRNKPCPTCKTNNLRVKKRTITSQEIHECDCCGYKKVMPVVTDNVPFDEMEYIPEKKGIQTEEPFGDPFEGQKSAMLTSINTPPSISVEYGTETVTASFKKVLSLETFLLERIGDPEQKLIVATGKAAHDAKYISLPFDHELDLQKYLAGDLAHIYGSGLADKDGMTYQLDFDIDDIEEYEHHEHYQKALAEWGISSFLFQRGYGNTFYKAHLVVRFNQKVPAESAKAYCLQACPKLAQIEECYPTGGKHNGRISWPFWQRRGDTVTACPIDIVLADKPDEVIHHAGIKAQPYSLPWLIERATSDAGFISEQEPEKADPQPQSTGGVLLDIPLPTSKARPTHDDGLKSVIIENANRLSWHDVVNGPIKNGRFCASWRDEDKPSVVIKGNYASDYGRTASGRVETHDKFDVYWLTRGKDPRKEFERLICRLKQQQEQKAS